MKKLILILVVLILVAAGIWYYRSVYQKKNRIVGPEKGESGEEREKTEDEKVIPKNKTVSSKYNPLVEQMQKLTNNVLRLHGQKMIAVDGIYGPETEAGIRKAFALKGTTPEKAMLSINTNNAVDMNFAAVFKKLSENLKNLTT